MLGIGVAHRRATQMDDRSQVMLLLKRGVGDSLGAERAADAAIEKRRGQLDRVAGHDARVQAVEPARSHRVPRSLLSHGMIVDAIALRFAERSIGNLVHADRARCRAVQLERIPGQLPAPGRAGYRIAGAFDLGERGEKRGRHDGRGVAPEPPPRPFRTQDQSAYTPVFLMIGPHLSISDLSRLRSDSGVALPTATGSAPRSASRVLKAVSVTAVCSAPMSLSSAALGVPLGANSPFQTTSAKPFKPSSSSVGTSGSEGTRIFEVTP